MKFRVLFVGGGTGGHVFPLIAVANAVKEKSLSSGVDLEILIIGEGQLLRDACMAGGFKFKSIFAGKIRRYFSFLNFLDIFKMPIGFIQSLWYVLLFMPNVVFAKGSYASFMPCLATKLYFIPLFIHESDSTAGLTNRIVGKLADRIFIAFKNAELEFSSSRCLLVGNPIRKELLGASHDEGLARFKLDANRKTILILGGSQGARTINNIILQSLVMLTDRYQIIHQCGEAQFDIVKAEVDLIVKEGKDEYADRLVNNYKLLPFFNINEMRLAYAASDIIVSRAGAANIFEIAAIGKPTIVIPITHSASNHQVLNAQEFANFGAIVIEEDNLATHLLINQIDKLLLPENYNRISTQIKSFAMVDAADRVADQLLLLNK